MITNAPLQETAYELELARQGYLNTSSFAEAERKSMFETINEKVSVVAIYNRSKGEVTPWRVKWGNKIYTITKIGFHHLVREGRNLQHIFSVTDGNMAFRLRCDTETLHWTLEEVSDGLAA